MSIVEEKRKKSIKVAKIIFSIILLVALLWFSLVLVEFYRVKTDKKPIICVNSVKDIEDDDEYSITCYGPLYKYREYHYNEGDAISAKEFTLMFKEFDRINIENQ